MLARLDSEDSLQRRNGLDVLTELVAVITKSTDTVDTPLRLFSCLASSLVFLIELYVGFEFFQLMFFYGIYL